LSLASAIAQGSWEEAYCCIDLDMTFTTSCTEERREGSEWKKKKGGERMKRNRLSLPPALAQGQW
jgi:hypothetical protein